VLPRVLEPETLDHLAPDDPAAQRARRDLRRVNAFMGARGILERALEKALAATDETVGGVGRRPAHPRDRLRRRPADARGGAASARALARGRARPARSPADRRSGDDRRVCRGAAGRRGRGSPTCSTGPRPRVAEHWDVVVANLFLHHFDGDGLRRLLAGCARRADALAACEPRRSRFALGASHLIFFLGANAVTRRDGVLSVRAGFVGHELSDAGRPGRRRATRSSRRAPGSSTNTTTASSPTASAPRWSAGRDR
jgi:hypothetical protein